MKTKTFIEKVEELGFKVKEKERLIIISANILDAPIITVRTDELYKIDSRRNHSGIDKKTLDYLFNYTVEYARTPLEKREEEKKYRYVFPFTITMSDRSLRHMCRNHNYVVSGESNGLILDSSSLEHVIKSELFHFTDKEVEEFEGKDRALFDACEKIEVAE